MHFFNRRKESQAKTIANGQAEPAKYQPPPGPPPGFPPDPPPLQPLAFPALASDDLPFTVQGWSALHLDDRHIASFQSLFAASKLFFDLPTSEKEKFKIAAAGSEAGWSRVEGEKELITLRTDTESTLPPVLREPALECWRLCGEVLNALLGRIAQSLGLADQALTAFSEPCTELKPKMTATMMRLFRYEGDQESKLVAEPHNDLGLLSIVFGESPGLQVWDRRTESWFPIEETYTQPMASVLVGQQLSRLTNKRYLPGAHRVFLSNTQSPPFLPGPPPDSPTPRYRFSIVFALRAHSPVPINTTTLTTALSGPFANPMIGITAGDLFKEISGACFNVNVPKPVREGQKARLHIVGGATKGAEYVKDKGTHRGGKSRLSWLGL